VESVLLAAIQRDLFTDEGFTVFKQEVAWLLAKRRHTQILDQERLHAKLAEVEREIGYIMKAIKVGILTVSTKAELEKAEVERGRLLSQLEARPAKADNVTTMLQDLKKRFKTLVGNLAATPHDHVAKAREALKSLLGSTIALHPCADTAGRYLTAEVTGDNEGVLPLVISKNKAGGGQGS
jgi:site-specific DNA recombinase